VSGSLGNRAADARITQVIGYRLAILFGSVESVDSRPLTPRFGKALLLKIE
jgi:hypothetical protein